MYYLITCVDSHAKHGTEGLVVENASEQEAYREMAEWAPILAEEWDMLIIGVSCVGGPYDPDEDGELLSTVSFGGPDRGAMLRSDMLWRARWTKMLERGRADILA